MTSLLNSNRDLQKEFSELVIILSQNQQCSDMVMSWVILKLFLYVVIIPFVLWILEFFRRNKTIKRFGVYAFGFWALLCAPDIAGLVIASKNNCDLALIDSPIDITITEYLYIGCISHIICITIIPSVVIVKNWFKEWDNDWNWYSCTVVCSGLFFLAWSVIGVILYAEMDQSNFVNKQCSDMILSWAILKIVECIPFKPFMIYLWIDMES